MLKLLILDFDGTIIETESCYLGAWRQVFAEAGCPFPEALFHESIGLSQMKNGDPFEILRSHGVSLTEEQIRARVLGLHLQLSSERTPLPGVLRVLETAHALGLKRAVASNSRSEWITRHLQRMKLTAEFDFISCLDHVARGKPAPDVYQRILDHFGCTGAEAIAFEDTVPGVTAAQAAGIPCFAVPGELTRHHVFPTPHLLPRALADFDLRTWMKVTHPLPLI